MPSFRWTRHMVGRTLNPCQINFILVFSTLTEIIYCLNLIIFVVIIRHEGKRMQIANGVTLY